MSVSTIVFDAGDTLIVIDPAETSPMVEWAALEAVPGVSEALAGLDGKYQLAVASNADVSNGPMIAAALARLGLEKWFTYTFSSVDLKARKPDLRFFKLVETALGVPSSQIAMVGDSYANDVAGAVQAGWRSVWYNPAGMAAPGLAPLHDAELNRMVDLPLALENLDLPTISEANEWLAEQEAGAKLMNHVSMVAALAYQLAVWLRQAGEYVDPVLTHRGGLLHDLAKVPAKAQNVDHGRLAGKMLTDRGQPILAQIADRHVLFNLLDEHRTPRTWEEKLVYYADKLVERGKIVNFRQRLAAMRERYKQPAPEEEMDRLISAISMLENEICGRLRRTPEQLLEQLRIAHTGMVPPITDRPDCSSYKSTG